jgi:hypothetical protein
VTFRNHLGWLLFALAFSPLLAHAATVSATLDRSSAQLGETVTLNVRVDGASDGVSAPDLRALSKDFDVLGSSQNHSLSVVNGNASSQLTFGVALRPRHVGTLEIPALNVAGEQTTPLQLQVTAPDPNGASGAHGDVFMETQVEPAQGYVGQQFSYVVRLFYASRIGGDPPQPPQIGGVELRPLGNGVNYQTQRDGRTYQVLEQRYALIPQHAGHIEIPPAIFQGAVTDPNDPNSFFGATVPVSASAPAQAIEVQAAPADWGQSAWLPARELSLSLDGWPTAQDAPPRVGQPINLTMNLQATGLSYETLPALSLPTLDGATVYPDKPVTGDHVDDQWITGRRQQSFAIVPERAGKLTIPATTLKWWNVQSGKIETAEIPARSITVLPAAGAAAAAPTAAAPDAPADAPVSALTPTATPWRWIALGSLALWLLSAVGWWLWRRLARSAKKPARTPPAASSRQQQLAFLAAARGSDSAAQAQTLLAWARAERPAIQHLGELSDALDDAAQRAAIDDLQQRRYASAPSASVVSDGLAEAFKRGFAWRQRDADAADDPLPPLYPFKLR